MLKFAKFVIILMMILPFLACDKSKKNDSLKNVENSGPVNNIPTQKLIVYNQIKVDGSADYLRITPDGQKLWAVVYNDDVYEFIIWDISTGKQIKKIILGNEIGDLISHEYDPQSNILRLGFYEEVVLLNLNDFALKKYRFDAPSLGLSLNNAGGRINGFLKGKPQVVFSIQDDGFVVWDYIANKVVRHFQKGKYVHEIAVSRTGEKVVAYVNTAAEEYSLYYHNLLTGNSHKIPFVWEHNGYDVLDIDYISDDKFAIVYDYFAKPARMALCDIKTGEKIFINGDNFMQAVFCQQSEDNKYLGILSNAPYFGLETARLNIVDISNNKVIADSLDIPEIVYYQRAPLSVLINSKVQLAAFHLQKDIVIVDLNKLSNIKTVKAPSVNE